MRAYIDTLLTEIAMLGRTLPKGVTLSRLHWGGGTPTLLSPDMIREVAQAVFDVAPLAPNAEFSVEIDPNEVDQARMDALAEMGMTRASIGVQDFDPEIQTVIGRIQSFETTKRAVDMIRDHGIQSLNTDILFGLPHQTKERITESVQKLLALSPDRVALYGYAHVPWMAKRQQMIPSDALPTPQERLRLFETARRLFLWDDYTEIGIDHFARKGDGLDIAARTGRLRRNFQGYTDDTSEVLIGLGASAGSYYPAVGDRLGCQMILPEHAGVANAIGAVVGRVTIRRMGTVTSPSEGRFRVHLDTGPEDFTDAETAMSSLQAALEYEARHEAEMAGAEDINMSVTRDVRSAKAEAREVFLEAEITVEATGRPRIAA